MTVIGIDVGGTKISAGIARNNKVSKVIVEKIYDKNSKNKVIGQIIKVVDQLFDSSVEGIGIGVPAIMDLKKGVIYESTNIRGWDRVPLKSTIEKRFKVPVIINNDANCFALGEKYFGKGKNYEDIVGFIIGTGVGAGIIINGKLYTGKNCSAGEFGKIPYLKHNVEYYCSGKFFQKEYNIRGDDLFQRAIKNDRNAKKIFEIYGKHLGKALSMVINSIDPQIIILGGGVSRAYSLFKNSMRTSLKEFVYKKTFKNIKITVSNIENIAILGATSLYFDCVKKRGR